ncbi:class II aldolase/adducin family protein [Olsenella porci]|uniref:Class II aldolase/adducin family protein n=1 Tax=Olsenella porci TaxID=2652279 RepID=A0A6N7X8W0_9ACTN|nr:class II aldolase/adducin family protein [Olsenella porci]MST71972.1 class II aldolase/adducin family protein [Olsenella porci]
MHEDVRDDICKVGRLLYDRGYVASNDGNVSVRVGANEVVVTPSGVSKGRMTPDMLVRCDLDGNVLPDDESGRFPSSEVKMHLAVYRERPDVRAVVHAHPVFATAFAICRRELSEPYLPELILNFGRIPVTDFAMLSTDEVPRSILPFVHDYNGVLLANHGAVAWGGGVWKAFDLMETIEHSAKVYKVVHDLGGGVELDPDQVSRLQGMHDFYRRRASARNDASGSEGRS